MNLNISYNWLKEYVALKGTVEEFAKKFSLHGPTVDRIEQLGKGLDDIVVGELLDISKHPEADKLSLATVNIGQGKTIVLIFGQMAKVAVGNRVPVAIAPTVMPDGKEIKKANIRGVVSEGMLCLDSEMGLSQETHLTKFGPEVKPGTPIRKAMHLNDALMDIEVTTNRPDAMSVVGLAREAAAITGSQFKYQEPKVPKGLPRKNDRQFPLQLTVKEKKLCPRFNALVMTDVVVKESPYWLQKRLTDSGIRPINNLVDITNYVLLEYGKPMHVYDYDKIEGHKIIVRKGTPLKGSIGKIENGQVVKMEERFHQEKILALDEKVYEIKSGMLVVADIRKPIGIAGVMGGAETGVTKETKTIVFESAIFDPVHIRQTSRGLNCYSESQALFEKGLPLELTELSIYRAVELTMELAGGRVVSKLLDSNKPKKRPQIATLDWETLNSYLGLQLPPAKVKSYLTSLGFKVSFTKNQIKAEVPFWRQGDVAMDKDLIEEIARLYGYHNLPSERMTGEIPTEAQSDYFYWQDKIKEIFKGFGLNEVYTYSFGPEKLLQVINVEPKEAVTVKNELSEDYKYLRTNLVPSLLTAVEQNQDNYKSGQLFELANVYKKKANKELPNERPMLAVAVWNDEQAGQEFYQAKGILEALLKSLNISKYLLSQGKKVSDLPIATDKEKVFEPGKALELSIKSEVIGYCGYPKNRLLSQMGIKRSCALVYLDVKRLIPYAKKTTKFKASSEFPQVERDLAFFLNQSIKWKKINDLILTIDNQLIKNIEPFDFYQGKEVPEGKKSVAFKSIYQSEERTLKQQEVDDIEKKIIKTIQTELGGKLRDD